MNEAEQFSRRPSASDRSPTMSWEEMLSALLTMVGRPVQVYIGSSALGGDVALQRYGRLCRVVAARTAQR